MKIRKFNEDLDGKQDNYMFFSNLETMKRLVDHIGNRNKLLTPELQSIQEELQSVFQKKLLSAGVMQPGYFNDFYPILERYNNKFGEWERISLLFAFMKMTASISQRSTCVRRRVGCIVVKNNLENVYSIGYNGSPSG